MIYPLPPDPYFERILLEKIAVSLTHRVHPSVLKLTKVDVYEDVVSGEFVHRLMLYITGQKLEDVNEKYPRDWREAFKERWFPKWALKYFPIKYRQIHISAKALYPKVAVPEESHYIVIDRRIYDNTN